MRGIIRAILAVAAALVINGEAVACTIAEGADQTPIP